MSIRTLIEINHDQLIDIENDPEGFAICLAAAIRSGGTFEQNRNNDGYDGDTHNRFNHFGGQVKHIRHHSDPCPTEDAGKSFVDLEVVE